MNNDEERLELLKELDAKVEKVFGSQNGDGSVGPHEEPGPATSNMIRMQRALSWLGKEGEIASEDDYVISYILHWISFESLYGRKETLNFNSSGNSQGVVNEIMDFLEKLEALEGDRIKLVESITGPVWKDVIKLFKNPYIDPGCWNRYYKSPGRKAGRNPFISAKRLPTKSRLADVPQFNLFLKQLFQRLYQLRNQLFHGNATYKGQGVNVRFSQVEGGAKVLRSLMPSLIIIMLDDFESDPASDRWGVVPYPRIKEAGEARSGRQA